MLLGLVVVPVVALVAVGGPADLVVGLAASHTEGLTNGAALLSPWGGAFSGAALMSAISLVAIGCGFLGSPQLFVRFISIKDVTEIGPGSLVAVIFTLLTDFGAVLAGMAGRVLVERNNAVPVLREMAGGAEISSAKEQILPYLSELLFPEMVTGVLVAIVLAAIMSTADSLLILVSSAVVRDIWNRALGVEMTDVQARGRARFVTALVCGVALLFSLDKESVLFDFVLFAWTGITATFCPPIILSLFWKGLTKAGTIAAMLWGLLWTSVWTMEFGEGDAASAWVTTYLWDGFSGSAEEAMIPAFFGALLVAVLVSLCTEPPEGAEQALAETRDQVVDIWR